MFLFFSMLPSPLRYVYVLESNISASVDLPGHVFPIMHMCTVRRFELLREAFGKFLA